MSRDDYRQAHATMFRDTRPGVRLTPLRNHRQLFKPEAQFWPRAEQLGFCIWLAVFDGLLILILAWQLWSRH